MSGWTRTATLVEPRVEPVSSLKRTKIRCAAGLKSTTPPNVTKTPNVPVAPALVVVVTLLDGGAVQVPEKGTVWHKAKLSGRLTLPVSAVAVAIPDAPTFTVATANAATAVVDRPVTMPSLFAVAARATTSGLGVDEADSRRVVQAYNAWGRRCIGATEAELNIS
jgi:hypothetical protein